MRAREACSLISAIGEQLPVGGRHTPARFQCGGAVAAAAQIDHWRSERTAENEAAAEAYALVSRRARYKADTSESSNVMY